MHKHSYPFCIFNSVILNSSFICPHINAIFPHQSNYLHIGISISICINEGIDISLSTSISTNISISIVMRINVTSALVLVISIIASINMRNSVSISISGIIILDCMRIPHAHSPVAYLSLAVCPCMMQNHI